jgi:hypothetical protein
MSSKSIESFTEFKHQNVHLAISLDIFILVLILFSLSTIVEHFMMRIAIFIKFKFSLFTEYF